MYLLRENVKQLFDRAMNTSNLEQQKELLVQTDALDAQINQIEEASQATKGVLQDLCPVAQRHFVTSKTLNSNVDGQLQEVIKPWPAKLNTDTIEQFLGEVSIILETWNIVVSAYTSFKDDVLQLVPVLGPSFERYLHRLGPLVLYAHTPTESSSHLFLLAQNCDIDEFKQSIQCKSATYLFYV